MKVSRIPWMLGCFSVTAGIAMQSIAHHKSDFNDRDRSSLYNTSAVTMVNGVGMCLLAMKRSKFAAPVFGLQFAGLLLFPGLVTYRLYYQDSTYSKYIPYGGVSIMLSWLLMGLI
ncbi:unnamed protein product [Moneuplotes crassus]|uniref:Transmembrane protein n=1 Tax=Euplotes crassus TaxID=5936 RepID=A0AAD1Y5M0_EUPCR|nr:unnamed protein product [Moneuplotes crassus]